MSIILKPEQEQVLQEAIKPGLAHTADEALDQAIDALRERYHRGRVHLALEKDTPEPRRIQPPECGRIVSIPVLGGLHHRYERRAA